MKQFRRLILRPLRRDLTRTLLTLVSIALGVAVVIAIELSGDAATGSFESSLTTLVGKVDYEITANGGVDEAYIAKLAALPVNARFSPVIEEPVVIAGRGSTTVFGVDFIANAAGAGETFDPEKFENTAIVSNDLAERLHLKTGDRLGLKGRDQSVDFTIRAIAPKQNTEWIAIDIAAAQRLLDMYGKLDRIEVFLAAGADAARVEHEIKATIPATWDLGRPGARSEENRRMLRAFRWNLRILSYISLLVGAFLIYNTIAVSVVRRRTEIGILRALGTSSRAVLLIFLGEAAMLGVVGSALGILLGRGLAAALLGMLSDTVNALFTTSTPGPIRVLLRGGDRSDRHRNGRGLFLRPDSGPRSRARGAGGSDAAVHRGTRDQTSCPARYTVRRVRCRRWRRSCAARTDRRQAGDGVCGHVVCGSGGGDGFARVRHRFNRDDARPAAADCRGGRAHGGAKPGGVARAHFDHRHGAGDGDFDDGERRGDGREFSRNRAGVAG